MGVSANSTMRYLKSAVRIFPGFSSVAILIALALVVLATIEMRRINETATRITADTLPSIWVAIGLVLRSLLRLIPGAQKRGTWSTRLGLLGGGGERCRIHCSVTRGESD
jgi:hypothetical protein